MLRQEKIQKKKKAKINLQLCLYTQDDLGEFVEEDHQDLWAFWPKFLSISLFHNQYTLSSPLKFIHAPYHSISLGSSTRHTFDEDPLTCSNSLVIQSPFQGKHDGPCSVHLSDHTLAPSTWTILHSPSSISRHPYGSIQHQPMSPNILVELWICTMVKT